MLKRHRSSVEGTEFMFAQLTSWVANTGFKTCEKLTAPKDFMPSQWGKRAQEQPKATVRMTKKRRQAVANGIDAFLGAIARKV